MADNNDKNNNIEKDKKIDWNIRPYLAKGVMVFLVFCACALVFFALYRINGVWQILDKIFTALRPILIGMIIAYLLNPIEKKIELIFVNRYSMDKTRKPAVLQKVGRIVSSILTLIIFIGFLSAFFFLIVPALVDNIQNFIDAFPRRSEAFIRWFTSIINGDGKHPEVMGYLMQASDSIQNWFNNSVMPNIASYVSTVTSGVWSVLLALKDFLIGLIIGVVTFIEKEHIEGLGKKMIYVFWKPKTANGVIEVVHKSHKVFGGFITGKIIDSIIIGILTFIVLLIVRMPYAGMIATIIGITNVIPFFGPLIGAIPCLVILLLVDPIYALWFLIIIILVQTFDGYVLGPWILGDSTGLSAFWVIFAIIVGGSLFGVPGMLISVPTFGVIYFLVERAFNRALEKKGLPTETTMYTTVTSVDLDTMDLNRNDWDRSEGRTPNTGILAKISRFFRRLRRKQILKDRRERQEEKRGAEYEEIKKRKDALNEESERLRKQSEMLKEESEKLRAESEKLK